MNTQNKIISLEYLPRWRKKISKSGRKLVVTNGCFDILHSGHVHYLEMARNLGGMLLVGINDDVGVKMLKGDDRPINNEQDRALVIAALESVDCVCIFPGNRATKFLEFAIPDIYVKGGDYTIETLDKEEHGVVQAARAEIVIVPFLRNVSTMALLNKIKQ